MTCVLSFPPLANPNAHLLILGSMPGVASLEAQRYYAHPRNAFWKILGTTFGFDSQSPYEERVRYVSEARVALWDVLASCARQGSLDADIDPRSAVPNDFADFFVRHQEIERVCFNGRAAESLFLRHVRPQLPRPWRFDCVVLPSTSAANAATSFADKARQWSEALRFERAQRPVSGGSPL